MSKRRRSRKSHAIVRYTPRPRRRARRNPGEELGLALANPRGGRFRRAASRARGGLARGLSFAGIGPAIKSAIPALAGILAASLFRKKWGEASGSMEPWKGKDYAVAGLGTIAASMVGKGLFRLSESTANLINIGGIGIILYHLLQDVIVSKSPTLKNWIGEESGEGSWTGASDTPPGYLPGDSMSGEDGATYVMGEDGNWRPIDESHRMTGYGAEVLRQPGALGDGYGAEVLRQPGPLGAIDPYDAAYMGD